MNTEFSQLMRDLIETASRGEVYRRAFFRVLAVEMRGQFKYSRDAEHYFIIWPQ